MPDKPSIEQWREAKRLEREYGGGIGHRYLEVVCRRNHLSKGADLKAGNLPGKSQPHLLHLGGLAVAKGAKGRVSIEIFRGRLRLVIPRQYFGGEQRRLSLGIPDSPQNRIIAETIARQMELDYGLGQFDPTLDKYRLSAYQAPKRVTLLEIFETYEHFKSGQLEASSLKDFARVRRYLERCPHKDARSAKKIRDWLYRKASPDTARRILVQLTAAGRWAFDRELVEADYFYGLYKEKIRVSKEDPDPFSASERKAILEGFKDDYHSTYVQFLFLTGCRPSEAIALQWNCVEPDLSRIFFRRATVEHRTKGLKTHKPRDFPCNDQLRELLASMEGDRVGLVFQSPKGKQIDPHNFYNRHWKPTLERVGVRYRPSYQCRHTFITECLAAGIDVVQVARWVGNSPEIIWRNYAGILTHSEPPILT